MNSINRVNILRKPVEHLQISKHDTCKLIDAMRNMSFTSREIARGADIMHKAVNEDGCAVILTIAGSTSAAGCMHIYTDLVEAGLVDAVVATGASIVDMDFFEALGFQHYQLLDTIDDDTLRSLEIDRIYDTVIDERELRVCDERISEIADGMVPGIYSSREFLLKMGEYLHKTGGTKKSLVKACYEKGVPIFCPAFIDSSAGFGIVRHQENKKNGEMVSIDSAKDFRELTELKIKSINTALFMIGGGVPKNFVQDTVVCADFLGKDTAMHKYAVQITVADPRDGACSSSTLQEACSWGKVHKDNEQMIFGEAGSILPLIGSYIFHKNKKIDRPGRKFTNLLEGFNNDKP